MATGKKLLQSVCADPPAELIAHFKKVGKADPGDDPLGFLGLDDAVAESASFRSFHPVAQALGLVMLDDPNTSNYHCYVSEGPLAGRIFYLSHDGDGRVVFEGLKQFAEAAAVARDSQQFLDELHTQDAIPAADQAALSAAISQLLQHGTPEATSVLVAYIPAMDLRDMPLLEQLATHEDFYVGEALGNAIAVSPRKDLLPVAKKLAKHKHSQTAEAGKRAVKVIK